jgi:hypothetical protein
LSEGIRGLTYTKRGEKDTGPMMMMMASERVKLPVTVPANWSDYTVLSLSVYYLRTARTASVNTNMQIEKKK